MKRISSFVVVAGLLVVAFLAGGRFARQSTDPAGSAATGQRAVAYYACPMHPQYRSDRPGDCPSCGMRLEPVYVGSGGKADAPAPDVPGAVRVNADRQQLLGVRVGEVRLTSESRVTLRVPGRVVVDEQRSYRIMAAVDGWVRQLGPNSAGSFVRKGQVLGSYYTQNLLSAVQTYVFALQTNAQAQAGEATIGYQRGPTQLSLQVALDSMRALGFSEFQIEEIKQTRVAPNEVRIYSPIDGFVIERGISPEQRFDKGSEMFRIADISHVWVLAEVFEKDREFLKPGALATVSYQGRPFEGRMSDALPQFDAQTRVFKTRFELNNPGNVLRPDLFVDVELQVDRPAALTVPADAVVDTGTRKTLFVDRGNGFFEPRAVETGWRVGDQLEITKGLMPGERVVMSGTFLLDSETRMKAAAVAAPRAKSETDVVCGMDIDPAKAAAAGRSIVRGGKTYYFCSEECRQKFEKAPTQYAK
jgi:membrane fusion protein, copper/silver efflux system